ncbi:MAG: ABC transporter permease subunit, partial [Chloroflexota bacterium]
EYELPERPSEETQHIRMIQRVNVGLPKLTQTTYDTWDKIIETVFMALLATTLGVAFSIPISFMAARNLMRDVKSSLASITLSVIGWPLGIALGFLIAQRVGEVSEIFSDSLTMNLGGTIIIPLLMVAILRWAVPEEELEPPGMGLRVSRWAALILASLLAILATYLLGNLGLILGSPLAETEGMFAFAGNFIVQLGDILLTVNPLIMGIIFGGTTGSLFGKLGQTISESPSIGSLKIANLVLSVIAGAILFGLLAYGINWIYEFVPLEGLTSFSAGVSAFWIPVLLGATIGLLLALFTAARGSLPIGMTIYYITRTLLNTVRSIEALLWAIIAVIWVGIGPFAGSLALAIHTVAALSKLYSEQVESIEAGPLEAVQATGANRLQTIIYAVVPQIIPPYISFTMYRWDINVRMSTIIGLVGGGGIGFLLLQNIGLLNYRAASVQMVAIAIVVASMDFISSYLRERYV